MPCEGECAEDFVFKLQPEFAASGVDEAHIEIGIVGYNGFASTEFHEIADYGFDGGCIGDHGIANACDFRDFCRDALLGADEGDEFINNLATSEFDGGEFDDFVGLR